MEKRNQSLPRVLYRNWSSHRGGALAAELTLFGILSALPVLLVTAGALGAVDSLVGVELAQDLEQFVIHQVGRVAGPNSSVIGVVAALFEKADRSTITVGLVFALYAGSRGMISLVGSLDAVFGGRSTEEERRGFIATRLVGVGLAGASFVVACASISMLSFGRVLAGSSTDGAAGRALNLGASGIGYLLAGTWLATMYRAAPRSKLPWGGHLLGAAVAIGGIDAVTRVFRWWIGVFDANAVFGVIGAAFSLLWWAYFCAGFIIFGAEVSAYHAARRSGTGG